MIDLEDTFNKIFKLDSVKALNDTFESYGYFSLYAVQNLGTITAAIFILPVLWAVSWSIYIILRGFKDYKAPWHKKLDRFVFFNGTFTSVDESYILLAMSAALNSYYFKWDSYGNIINSIFTVVLWGVIVGAPFFLYNFYRSPARFQKILNRDKVFMEKFGELLEPLQVNRRGRLPLLYLAASQIRRLVLVMTVVYL